MGKRIWMTLIGVWLIGISAGIFSYSNLGMDPYQTFAHGIDIYTPLGFGVTYMIICGLNVLIDLFLDKSKIGLATIINVFFLGYVVEFVETMLGIWVPMPTLAMRILMLLIALLIMCFATALCMTADLGVSCYDVIGMFIADKTNFKFKYVRIVCDIIFVSIGFFLGAKVGIATIITAFFMGPFISFFRVRVTDPMLLKKGMSKAMKIGIMGGTFYPIHNGHLMLADYALNQYELDKIWFMPNGSPPHKSNKMIEDRTGQRITMVKLAIGGRENFVFQPYEVENAEISYSYKTMEHFREAYPEDAFYFIIGADSLFMLEKWKCPERLLRACVVLAACRDDKSVEDVERKIQYLNQKYDADIRLLKTPKVEISSSEIRKRIQEGHPVEDMLPKAVYDYICEKQLFRDDEDETD